MDMEWLFESFFLKIIEFVFKIKIENKPSIPRSSVDSYATTLYK
ncbi:hypothetical protein J2810_004853 [Chryseobacterium rhizosphaerae]|nr:hypothetical protein [Chryseobacterium rhizosphaerae]